MKKSFLYFILIISIVIVSACGSSEPKEVGSTGEPIELKLGTKMPDDSEEGKAFQHFADLVKEKSDGELVVKVFPAEQLGTGTTQIDNMLLGTQDMYAEGITYFSDYDPRVQVSGIPYLFRDFEHYQQYNTGEMGKVVHDNLISEGIRILNTERNFVRGPYRVLLSTKPVKTVNDLKGLKLRSFESEFYSAAYESVGANPTVVAWTETYLAIKQNLVDGVTSPISLAWSMKFSEVAPYMTIIDEYPQDVVIAMNEDKFSELSEEYQEILIDAANETGEYATSRLDEQVEEDIEKMKEEHGIEVLEINKEEWVEAFSDFHQELEDSGVFPDGYIDEIKSIE